MKIKLLFLGLISIFIISCENAFLEENIKEADNNKTVRKNAEIRIRAHYYVNTLAELKEAVENNPLGRSLQKVDTVCIMTTIDITNENYNLLPITIKGNILITGNSENALLDDYIQGNCEPSICHKAPYSYSDNDTEGHHSIFLIPSGIKYYNIKFENLLFEGPLNKITSDYYTNDSLANEFSCAILARAKIRVNNCEFRNWNIAMFLGGANDSEIFSNYIHDNNMDQFVPFMFKSDRYRNGYGIGLFGKTYDVEIKGNLFKNNKHSVSSDGHEESSYFASYNVITGGGSSSHFDVHSCNEPDKYEPYFIATAGKKIEVSNNIWHDITTGVRAVNVRGKSIEQNVIENNYFANCAKFDFGLENRSFYPCFDQNTNDGCSSVSIDENNEYTENYVEQQTYQKSQILIGDFDKDGEKELLFADGTAWYIADIPEKSEFFKSYVSTNYPTYISNNVTLQSYIDDLKNKFVWKFVQKCSYNAWELKVGDFNGDGYADIFHIHDNHWNYYDLNRNTWNQMRSNVFSFDRIIIGDIDKNGESDILCYSWGDGKFYPYMEDNSWEYIGNSIKVIPFTSASDYRLCCFDDDEIHNDLLYIENKVRKYYSIDTKQWKDLHTSNWTLADMNFGDIDNNGITDILYFSAGDNKIYPYMDGISYIGNSIVIPEGYNAYDFFVDDFDGGDKDDFLYIKNSEWKYFDSNTRTWKN